MRVLLIGGNGFIGTPLGAELVAAGHEVAVFHRGRDRLLSQSGVLEIYGDRNRLFEGRDRMHSFGPEVIVDLILSSAKQAGELTELAAGRSRLVVLSSMDVYRAWGVLREVEPPPLEPLPITEDSPLRTVRELYGSEDLAKLKAVFGWLDADYDKVAVEQTIVGSGVRSTILRLPMIYGPRDPLHRLFPPMKPMADQRPAIILAEDFAAWRGPRGYVDNVAHAIRLAVESPQSGRIYNVCEEPCLSELEWHHEIQKQTDWKGRFVLLPRERMPKHLLVPGNFQQSIAVSGERIRRELGYREQIPYGEAIGHTLEWERKHPPPVIDPGQFDYDAEDRALRTA